ncbi:MAG: galactose-1-phosphate uridylyltransferase [Bacillota bacterium]|jgi:UDPglucose--hexose-1-phosphate uridylyltransferase
MPEFRQDIITGNWVIVAKERARRPEDFSKPEKPHKEHYRENCPFCVGNEGQTPPEVYAVRRDGSQPDQPGWKVRAVPNKFPALTSNGQVSTGDVGIYRTMSGVGAHEVILETPDHDRSPAELTQQELEDVIATYRHRYRALLEDDRIKYVSIFRNHGRSAGASLEHPHSQVIATPIVPPRIQDSISAANDYHSRTGKCVYCYVLEEEREAGVRVVYSNPGFVVFEPFASRTPFETCIMPLRHSPSFGEISDQEIQQLADALGLTMRKIADGLNDPPYNYVIRTAPIGDEYEDSEHLHWHIRIFPKLAIAAGFEMGTGIYINTATPEDTAKFLRNI